MKTILGLCDRFRALPSQVAAEDADVLRMLAIEAMARRPEAADGGQ